MTDDSDHAELYEECVAMLAGATRKIPTREHLFALRDAMQAQKEVMQIRIINELAVMKQRVQEMS